MEDEPIPHFVGRCNECGGRITITGTIVEGEIVVCADCGIDLEVTETNGKSFEVKLAPQEAEDWGE